MLIHNVRWTKEQKEQVLQLRNIKDLEYSQICKIMNLTQRKARSLYNCAKNYKPVKR